MRSLTTIVKSWFNQTPAPMPVAVPEPSKPIPPAPVDDRDEYELLDALVDRLNNTPVMTAAQEAALDAKRRELMNDWIGGMLDEGLTYNQASGGPEIYNQPEADFKDELKRTDSNLRVQIDRFDAALDRWFETGEGHPPYWPWRIAVILSKRKELEREKRFLAAYCRHFWNRKGRRDEMILERAEKKGAFDRFKGVLI